MVVGDGTRTCGEDKRWSGQDPKCKEINCGSPGFLPNGMYNQAFLLVMIGRRFEKGKSDGKNMANDYF